MDAEDIEMAEFQEGTLDTLMERLCNSISGFDPEWVKALRACSRRTDSAVTGYSGGIPLYNTGGISLVFKKNGEG